MGSVILTVIYNLSGGSVIAAILFHLCNNIGSAFDKNYIVAAISTGLSLLAVFLVIKYKTKDLSGDERVKNYFAVQPAR